MFYPPSGAVCGQNAPEREYFHPIEGLPGLCGGEFRPDVPERDREEPTPLRFLQNMILIDFSLIQYILIYSPFEVLFGSKCLISKGLRKGEQRGANSGVSFRACFIGVCRLRFQGAEGRKSVFSPFSAAKSVSF